MTESPDPLSPLGDLLESKRIDVLKITGREAARRAHVSESRWRQVVKGARASGRVVVAMALAVGVEPAEALQIAEVSVDPGNIDALVADVRRGMASTSLPNENKLVVEIERVNRLPISTAAKQRITSALIDTYEKAAAEASQLDIYKTTDQTYVQLKHHGQKPA